MKLYTKWLSLVLAALLTVCAAATLSACAARDADPQATGNSDHSNDSSNPGNENNAEATDDRSLQEIYDDFIAKVELGEITLVQSEEGVQSFEYYFGINKPADVKGTYISEPTIGTIPFTVHLLRVGDASDAASIAAEIKEKVEPRRWVCAAATYVETAVRGDVILLVMDNNNERGSAIVEAFKNL